MIEEWDDDCPSQQDLSGDLPFLPSFVAASGNGRRNPLQVILTAAI